MEGEATPTRSVPLPMVEEEEEEEGEEGEAEEEEAGGGGGGEFGGQGHHATLNFY